MMGFEAPLKEFSLILSQIKISSTILEKEQKLVRKQNKLKKVPN